VNELVTCPACGGSGLVAPSPLPADEQTLRDRDQTASDSDQTWSDHDQTGSDRDQRSSDEDQQASNDDLAGGGDADLHDRTAAARSHASHLRDDVSRLRDETAAARSEGGQDRDETAEFRDRDAEAHEQRARLEGIQANVVPGAEDILLRAERQRADAAADRASAAEDRSRAAADRDRAAADRDEAAHEREEALHAQAEAEHTLVLAATDELTGAWTRKFGLASVAREIERASRTGVALVLAFIDVDGLKEVNDKKGHPDGDRLLRLVVETLRANLRSYDVIVRYGGDEFLCVMPSFTRSAAEDRMKKIADVLSAARTRHSITFGLAEYEAGDGLETLVSRADADLLDVRRSHRGGAR
jgi:diguanylate cyclase (GGDEF)-like protein